MWRRPRPHALPCRSSGRGSVNRSFASRTPAAPARDVRTVVLIRRSTTSAGALTPSGPTAQCAHGASAHRRSGPRLGRDRVREEVTHRLGGAVRARVEHRDQIARVRRIHLDARSEHVQARAERSRDGDSGRRASGAGAGADGVHTVRLAGERGPEQLVDPAVEDHDVVAAAGHLPIDDPSEVRPRGCDEEPTGLEVAGVPGETRPLGPRARQFIAGSRRLREAREGSSPA